MKPLGQRWASSTHICSSLLVAQGFQVLKQCKHQWQRAKLGNTEPQDLEQAPNPDGGHRRGSSARAPCPHPHVNRCSGATDNPLLPVSAPSTAGYDVGRHRASRSHQKRSEKQTLALGHFSITDGEVACKPKHSCIHNFKVQALFSPSLPVVEARLIQAGLRSHAASAALKPWAGCRDAIKVIRETKEEKGKEADRSKHRWMH